MVVLCAVIGIYHCTSYELYNEPTGKKLHCKVKVHLLEDRHLLQVVAVVLIHQQFALLQLHFALAQQSLLSPHCTALLDTAAPAHVNQRFH